MQEDIDEINALIKEVAENGGVTMDDFINLALMVRHMRELIGKVMGE